MKENAEGTYKTKHAEAARLTYTNEFVQRERFRAENERECHEERWSSLLFYYFHY